MKKMEKKAKQILLDLCRIAYEHGTFGTGLVVNSNDLEETIVKLKTIWKVKKFNKNNKK